MSLSQAGPARAGLARRSPGCRGALHTILPPAYGLATLLPALAGLAAVVSMWRAGRGSARP